jgi:hypothetical protein
MVTTPGLFASTGNRRSAASTIRLASRGGNYSAAGKLTLILAFASTVQLKRLDQIFILKNLRWILREPPPEMQRSLILLQVEYATER